MLRPERLEFASLGWYAIRYGRYGTIFSGDDKVAVACGVRWDYILKLYQEIAQAQSTRRRNNGREKDH